MSPGQYPHRETRRSRAVPIAGVPLAGHVQQVLEGLPRPAGGRGERPERIVVPATGQVLEEGEQSRVEAVVGRTPSAGQVGEAAFDVPPPHHLVGADTRQLVVLGHHVVDLPSEPVQGRRGEAVFPDVGRSVVGDADDDLVGSRGASRCRVGAPAHRDDAARVRAGQLTGRAGCCGIVIRSGHDTCLSGAS
ncbi:hypothetical protein [Micromonospora sp. WMMD812]|uniref:hypothetical protein n=1 Tax=Micromonospora sp. WMMD812 TaxID=3015152 RepID=UPI00248B5CA4|nr:hypothetical protein [Micromonospora sp. WMMD812]WBB69257.1 hypothetical protein O7603_07870 [Micromonospora sp. WMMD812]